MPQPAHPASRQATAPAAGSEAVHARARAREETWTQTAAFLDQRTNQQVLLPERDVSRGSRRAFGVAYLMDNNTLMESMFRYEPVIVLYAPLHIVIWGDPVGPGYLTFDKPSDQFDSFGNTEVSNVGAELDHKLAALLEHLAVSVPDDLLRPGQSAC